MNESAVRDLSQAFSPPRMNLRTAARRDSPYGDDIHADRDINHRLPDDVSRTDLDFYAHCFSYMDFPSLLFYLYPVAAHYEHDNELACVDPFLYSLDSFVPASSSFLPAIQQSAIYSGLRWMQQSCTTNPADFAGCPNLCSALGQIRSKRDG